MKLGLALLALCMKYCLAEVCNHENWQCINGVATLQSIPVGNDILNLKLSLKFEPEENIKTVEIDSEESIFIYQIIGPNIETIKISGGQKKIETLCTFLNTTDLTPKLKKVEIHDTVINDFYKSQDCGTDASKVPLTPTDTSKVDVSICILIRALALRPKNRSAAPLRAPTKFSE